MVANIEVWVDLGGYDALAGTVYSHRRRQTESATFIYDASWLARPDTYELDPALPLVSGGHQTPDGRAIFGAFADSSPDRWGRNLVLHAERLRARDQSTTSRSFGEFDLLLGVRDDLRQGALRFRVDKNGPFLATEQAGVPVLTDLASLLNASDRAGTDEASRDDLAALLRAGSSLGGARPKAHVLDAAGRLAIAKFPSPSTDRWNVMAWEKTALDLAALAGINTAKSQLIQVGGRDVLVVDRFDRDGDIRIGYVSAITMVEARDGDHRSYLDIAGIIEQRSPAATSDLRQLWRRIALSVLISNTDDHLRNHGFVHHSADSWVLSPAFDINPNPDPGPKHLATAIEVDDTTASIDNLMRVAPLFRLDHDSSVHVLHDVVGATRQWKQVARSHGLTGPDVDNMAPAFEHAASRAAAELTGH